MTSRIVTIGTVIPLIFLVSCATLPKGASVVEGFQLEKYLGHWYEIARLDFAFERDLDNTTAEYRLRADGSVSVKNRGRNIKTDRWEEANGVARFRGSVTVGALEVSFFGPFFAVYNVIQVDEDYRYALVAGSSTNYLWILSRETTIPDEIKTRYLALARKLGYRVENLVWVKHTS